MTPLSHYIVVRRDLPYACVLAQVAHAAGESMFALGQMWEEPLPFDSAQTIAIVLGARNEGRLRTLMQALATAAIAHVAIVETDGVYAGQLMALGLVPCNKTHVKTYLRDFHMFPEPA